MQIPLMSIIWIDSEDKIQMTAVSSKEHIENISKRMEYTTTYPEN